MKNMEKIITGLLIIVFLGWLAIDNCCTEKEGCAADCVKSCCISDENTEDIITPTPPKNEDTTTINADTTVSEEETNDDDENAEELDEGGDDKDE